MHPQRHIAMIASTAPSHIYPSLGVIAELVRRGHRVSYVVGEPLTDLIAPTGAEIVPHPTLLPIAGANQENWPDDPIAGMRLFLDEGIAVLPGLLEHFAADPPDLILYDIGGLSGPVLASRLGVTAVQLSPTYVTWDGYEDDMAEFITAMKSAPTGQEYYAVLQAWLAEYDVDTAPDDFLGKPPHGIVLIPRALQPNAERVSDRFEFVGPCLDPDRLAAGGWTPPDDAPVLYVSFGTAFTEQLPVYRAVIEAFGGSHWHVVLVIGTRVALDELGPVPANIEVMTSAPQLAVLEYASAFVTHAGMGSTMESLWFGVPTVAVPQGYDQDTNADHLVALGVCRRIDTADVTAAALRTAIEFVAHDPEVRRRLAAIRKEVRSQGGVNEAADAVERFLQG